MGMEVVLGGITSLSDELTWFKNEASKWDIMLQGIAPQKTNQNHCRWFKDPSRVDRYLSAMGQ
ncbi:hypothetical protein MKW92_022422 [Papaver armeniacum]|nr:hypothetical protein MKW92_022422 [Papaver armeniacum]